jgi:hypothetical protein
MSDLTKAPDQIVLDLINTDNSTSLTLGLLDFGLPTVTAGETPEKNTTLTVTAKAGSGYTGSQVVQYNRVNLSTIPGIAEKEATYQLGDALKVSDLIDEINAMYGIKLVPADYVDADLPTFEGLPNEEHTVQLVAAADSLIYIGSLVLTLKSADIELSSVITVTALNGLTYVKPVDPA